MPYIAYLPYIPNIPYFPNMPYQTDHTHHTYPPYHTTPPPHHGGWGRSRGHMGPIPWGFFLRRLQGLKGCDTKRPNSREAAMLKMLMTWSWEAAITIGRWVTVQRCHEGHINNTNYIYIHICIYVYIYMYICIYAFVWSLNIYTSMCRSYIYV